MPAMRMPSPRTGSTLMTSAPRSPSSMVANGPGQVLAQIEHHDTAQRAHGESSSTTPASTIASISPSEYPHGEQDLPAVLAHPRLAALDRAGRGGEHGRHADLRGPTELVVLDGRRHLVGDELGMGEDVGHRGHRLGPEPRLVERLDQLPAGPLPVGLTEPGIVAGPQLGVGVDLPLVHGVETEDLLGRARRRHPVHGGGVDPLPVGTLEE